MQKAWKTRELDAVGARPTLLSGAALGVLWVGWPALAHDGADIVALALTTCAALVLIWSARRLAQPERLLPRPLARMASWFRLDAGELESALLLIAVPFLLASAVAFRPEAVNQQTLDAVVIVPAALALCWYGDNVLRLSQAHTRVSIGTTTPLGARPYPIPISPWERRRRPLLVGAFTLGGIAIGIVAPTVGGYEPLAESWQDAAAEGALLTAVLASSLGVAAVGLFLSESLRPTRATTRPPGGSTRRALGYLLLAGLTLAALWAIG